MHRIGLASPDDASAVLGLLHQLDAQSSFMLLEPGVPGPLVGSGGSGGPAC